MPLAPDFRVDFLVGGTQKGGTSALANFLRTHPEICLSKHKEVHFFDAPDFRTDRDPAEALRSYRRHFPKESKGQIVGEATPAYMFLPPVPERVHQYNPAMKWVLLLRNPIERALSHYAMERTNGRERLPLPLALRVEKFRLWQDRGWMAVESSLRHHSYVARGLYSEQIARLWKLFSKDQVLVLTSDDLRSEHAQTLRTIFRFLGVNENVDLPAPEIVFETKVKPVISDGTRAWLHARFTPEIARLEAMLGRSLPSWRVAG